MAAYPRAVSQGGPWVHDPEMPFPPHCFSRKPIRPSGRCQMTGVVPKEPPEHCQGPAVTKMLIFQCLTPPASSQDYFMVLSLKNNPVGAAGGWHRCHHAVTNVSLPNPICTPGPAMNPIWHERRHPRSHTGFAKEVSKGLEQPLCWCLPICSSLGK